MLQRLTKKILKKDQIKVFLTNLQLAFENTCGNLVPALDQMFCANWPLVEKTAVPFVAIFFVKPLVEPYRFFGWS